MMFRAKTYCLRDYDIDHSHIILYMEQFELLYNFKLKVIKEDLKEILFFFPIDTLQSII